MSILLAQVYENR